MEKGEEAERQQAHREEEVEGEEAAVEAEAEEEEVELHTTVAHPQEVEVVGEEGEEATLVAV